MAERGGGGRRSGRGDGGRDPAVHRADDRAVYIISVAAELAGVHPQTLRIYERRGLLRPKRTAGNTRRYSERDIDRLRTIQALTQRQRVNLAGVKLIMDMESELEELRRRAERLEAELEATRRMAQQMSQQMAEGSARRRGAEIVPLRTLVTFPWLGELRP